MKLSETISLIKLSNNIKKELNNIDKEKFKEINELYKKIEENVKYETNEKNR